MSISLFLLVLALVLFLCAAFSVPSGRVNLVAAGLAAMVLAQLVGGVAIGKG